MLFPWECETESGCASPEAGCSRTRRTLCSSGLREDSNEKKEK